jgi:hypothetical protein
MIAAVAETVAALALTSSSEPMDDHRLRLTPNRTLARTLGRSTRCARRGIPDLDAELWNRGCDPLPEREPLREF